MEENEKSEKKIVTIGKGYSYLFAIFLTALVSLQALDLQVEYVGADKNPQIKIATREVPAHVFIPSVVFIASILGLNTDAITAAVGRLFGRETSRETNEREEEE
ncbi:MAG: hypothetical protein KME29_05065 [Calothrix sp. FI2-JRJ7]|jgi:hypothetical protein|nr:hypothetical protein [Calothrix sp. FI2-JRJ7]